MKTDDLFVTNKVYDLVNSGMSFRDAYIAVKKEYFKNAKNNLVEDIYMNLVLMYITVTSESNLHYRYSIFVGKPELIEQL